MRQLFMLFVLLCAMNSAHAADAERVAHWKFDGNADDAGKEQLNGKATGRVEFFDSPVGGTGQLLSLNGVDAFVRMEKGLHLGNADFSISVWVLVLEARNTAVLADGAIRLRLQADGAVALETSAGNIRSGPGRIIPGQWVHVVASVHRADAGGASKLFINGTSAASGDIKAAALDSEKPLQFGKLDDGKLFNGLLDDISIYRSALSDEQVAALTDTGLPWLRAKPHLKTPFAAKFALEPDDTVLFIGGENLSAASNVGCLETFMTASASGRAYFRNMAWEGDSVFEQWRIVNFGSWQSQFERTGASVLLVQFGQMESLQGASGLPAFTAAYEKLLDAFSRRTQRIIVLSPPPFGPTTVLGVNSDARNTDLKVYGEAMRAIAVQRKFLYVDLFTALQASIKEDAGLTRDSVQLTDRGQRVMAQAIAQQLAIGDFGAVKIASDGSFEDPSLENLRQTIGVKNKLWMNYSRPNNWAFLNGDRVQVPSSRDHVDARVRWFPAEVQQYPALILRQEQKIEQMRVQYKPAGRTK